MRCMAMDRYDEVQDNLAAVAATLEAMRSIERHGGAAILDRAFTGFAALPAPEAPSGWWVVLGVAESAGPVEIRAAHRVLAQAHHPDRGGDPARMAATRRAWRRSTPREIWACGNGGRHEQQRIPRRTGEDHARLLVDCASGR